VASARSSLLALSPRESLLRRLHSLSGVFPVGIFLIAHMATNVRALWGQAAYEGTARRIARLPLMSVVEIFVVLLPLAFHAAYGVKLAIDGRPNPGHYPDSKDWIYTFQRVTGLIAFAFIVWHVWDVRLARITGTTGAEAFYPTLSQRLSSTTGGVPWVAVGYLVGITASISHFFYGLFTFSLGWGLCTSQRAQRLLGGALGFVGLLIFLVSADTALYFATGARLPGLSQATLPASRERCIPNPAPAR
jgi:succinate dehydrogenase / fumarate reductase cytochrome b subunit